MRLHPIREILHNVEGAGKPLIGDNSVANYDDASEEEEDDDEQIEEARERVRAVRIKAALAANKKVLPKRSLLSCVVKSF